MTPERITELAKQAGLLPNHEVYDDDLQRFYELVRNEALEEAAMVVEPSDEHKEDPTGYIGGKESMEMLREIAMQIRSLKK